MKTTVYVDVLILVNFIVNYFILKGSATLARSAYNNKRLILSAFVGAVFSFAIFLEINSLLFQLLIKCGILIICVLIAFGYINKRLFIRNIICFLTTNAIVAGLFMAFANRTKVIYHKNLFFYFNISPILLVICVLVVWIVITLFNLVIKDETVSNKTDVNIRLNDKSLVIQGFYDTGFKLVDILGGKAVLLIDYESIKPILTDIQIENIQKFFLASDVDARTIITPVFYSTINGNGVLPAIKPDKILILHNNKFVEVKNVLIALVKDELSKDVQVIYGKEIQEMLGDNL